MLNFRNAIAMVLEKHAGPVITQYGLAVIISRLATEKMLHGEVVDVRLRSGVDRAYIQKKIRSLCAVGIIQKDHDFPSNQVFRIFGRSNKDPQEIACCVDPFCYLSHISAMAFHGVTDRFPSIVQLSTPKQTAWVTFAQERMLKDYGMTGAHIKELPKLERVRFERIQSHPIHLYQTAHMGAFKTVRETSLRVSTMGRTFLDMVREPKLCGGIRHVVEVYEEYARTYLKLIVEEVDRNGNQIEKVRAGYLLDEVCGLEHEKIEAWREFVQRGGSRKLDPNAEYRSEYSEKWCLSINI